MDIMITINKNLEKFNLNKKKLDEKKLDYLYQIQKAINESTSNRENALEKFKDNKLSINSVSQNIDIARQTFYNNPILKKYLNEFIELEEKNDPFVINKNLKEKLQEKKEIIDKLINRDAKITDYKIKNEALKNEIISLKKTIASQQQANNQLIKKLNQK